MSALPQSLPLAGPAWMPRTVSIGPYVDLLADIYRDDISLCIWERPADSRLDSYARGLFQPQYVGMTWQCQGSPAGIGEYLLSILPAADHRDRLIDDIVVLADMFSTLLAAERVGLRMSPLRQAMCPRFHVDRVPCRLVTTYGGPGTQWIPHAEVNRDKLGHRSQGMPDETSGLIRAPEVIRQMEAQHVGLMKGETWPGNEGGGVVHRSPALSHDQARLVVTFDVIS